MPTKKTANKTDFEKKFDDVKKTTTKTAKQVEKEFRSKTSGLSSWWSGANDEEKIYMVLWLILLIIGLYLLLDLMLWLLLIITGILFVTWFFVKKHK